MGKTILSEEYISADMETSIPVSSATKRLLASLKKREQKATYDALIRELVREHVVLPKSMFGSVKGLKWKKEDRLSFHEL